MERTVQDVDRISLGWQVWLTLRQTRIIRDALLGLWAGGEEQEHLHKWSGLTQRRKHKRASSART